MSFRHFYRTAALVGLIILAFTVGANSSTTISPEEMTETAIGETHFRIYLYMKEHRKVPPNLSVLPKREGYANRTTDGWNRGLHFSVDKKGVITLSSFGADGRPGGNGPNRDFTHRYETRKPDGALNIDDKFWIIKEIRDPSSTASVQQAEAKDTGSGLNYQELVKGLVSPNKPVKCYDENKISFPPGYDKKAQVAIEKNRRLLYEHCEEALPFLIEGCNDTRYSLTWQSDSYCDNSCVGEVCLEIIASHLEVYRSSMSLRSKTSYYAYRFVPRINGAIGEQVTKEKRKEIEDWWQGRKGKTLLELQIEAFDWAIEKRNKEVGTREEEADKAKEIARLVIVRNNLRKDGKCLPPLHISSLVGGSREKRADN